MKKIASIIMLCVTVSFNVSDVCGMKSILKKKFVKKNIFNNSSKKVSMHSNDPHFCYKKNLFLIGTGVTATGFTYCAYKVKELDKEIQKLSISSPSFLQEKLRKTKSFKEKTMILSEPYKYALDNDLKDYWNTLISYEKNSDDLFRRILNVDEPKHRNKPNMAKCEICSSCQKNLNKSIFMYAIHQEKIFFLEAFFTKTQKIFKDDLFVYSFRFWHDNDLWDNDVIYRDIIEAAIKQENFELFKIVYVNITPESWFSEKCNGHKNMIKQMMKDPRITNIDFITRVCNLLDGIESK